MMEPPINERTRAHDDNVGLMKMTRSRFRSLTIRHVDVKYHTVRDAINGGIFCVEHVRSKEKYADIVTYVLDFV